MRILWVKADGLWPPDTGGRLRSFHILAELARRHPVTVATTHGPGDDPQRLARALPPSARVISVPHAPPAPGSPRFAAAMLRAGLSLRPIHFWRWRVPALRRLVAQMMTAGEIDLCVADFLKATPNLPVTGRVPTVLFAHNAEHVIWERLSRIEPWAWQRALSVIEWRKVRTWEAGACAQAALTVAVSDVDRRALTALSPLARVRVIPTGVDLARFAPNGAHEVPGRLVFTGSMDWYPNEDAMLYFVDGILPMIRREMPAVSLTIVGRNPTARLRAAAAAAGVRVTGTVDDVRPYVSEASVYVIPLRAGGGTRLKLFEALAMGKAVVSTAIGAEGLPLTPGEHFLQADAPEEFARATISLLRDPGRRAVLGRAGRQLVEARYSWTQVAREFEARCEEVVSDDAH